MVPLLDGAVGQVGSDVSHGKIVQNLFSVVGLHPAEHRKRAARDVDVDQRLLRAGAETSHAGKLHIRTGAIDGFLKSVKHAFPAIAATARAHSDGHTRD